MKNSQSKNFIAIFEAMASSPTSAYQNFFTLGSVLGDAIVHEHVGCISRAGSPFILSVVSRVADHGGMAISISPASSALEHIQAFRFPVSSVPTVYSGRGGLGADSIVAASSHAALIIGSEDEALESILGFLSDKNIPVAVLTEESSKQVHERIYRRYPAVARSLVVSNDPAHLVRELAEHIRTRSISEKNI